MHIQAVRVKLRVSSLLQAALVYDRSKGGARYSGEHPIADGMREHFRRGGGAAMISGKAVCLLWLATMIAMLLAGVISGKEYLVRMAFTGVIGFCIGVSRGWE
jgi:hypothetical protein